jgi:hypothetical protein
MYSKIAFVIAMALFALNIAVFVGSPTSLYAEKAGFKTCGCNGGTGPDARICVEWLYDECTDVDGCDNDCDPYDPPA